VRDFNAGPAGVDVLVLECKRPQLVSPCFSTVADLECRSLLAKDRSSAFTMRLGLLSGRYTRYQGNRGSFMSNKNDIIFSPEIYCNTC
jgi:hypothetical protein